MNDNLHHTIYHTLVLLPHYQTTLHTIYHTHVLLSPVSDNLPYYLPHTCTITTLSD